MTSFPQNPDALERGRTLLDPEPILPAVETSGAEFVITGRMQAGEPIAAVFRRLVEELTAQDADLLSLMIYGSLLAKSEIDAAMRNILGDTAWPVTWVEGASCDGLPLAGVQAFAISRREVTRVRLGGRVVASVYEDGGARHCLLGGFGPNATSLRAPAQA